MQMSDSSSLHSSPHPRARSTSHELSLIPTLLIYLFLSLICACEDTTATQSEEEGCDGLASSCPEGTSCQLDPLGNPFCAQNIDPPLMMGGVTMTGGRTDQAGAVIAGEIAGEEPAGSSAGAMSGELAGQAAGMPAGSVGGERSVEPAGSPGGEPPAGETTVSCDTFETSLKPAIASIPQVMIAVDRSYSMINVEDRWTPALRALSQVTQALEEDVSFGLALFPDPLGGQLDSGELAQCTSWGRDRLICEDDLAACVPGRVFVEPAVNNSLSIRETLNNNPPEVGQGTPTHSVLLAAAASLNNQPNSGEKVIILVTDGMPGCNFYNDPSTCNCLYTNTPFLCELDDAAVMCLDAQRTIEEVERLAGTGIRTVVVGLTIGLSPEGGCRADGGCPYGGQECINGQCLNVTPGVLSNMARAGGDPSGAYFSAEDVDSIEAQITRATASVAPCVFDISNIPPDLYERLVVYVDGAPMASDPMRMNGWWAEDGSLEFYGPACEGLRDGLSHRIAARCE